MTTITISKEFSRYPFGRFVTDGPYSGERFREEFLRRAFDQGNEDVIVVLDGANGMGSSFLEEAFGGLVRVGIGKSAIHQRLKIVSQDATRASQIMQYVDDAVPPAGGKR